MQLAPSVVIQAADPLSKAISLIEQNGVGVLVFDGKKYLGIIDERILRTGGADPRTTRAKTVAVHTPILSPNVSTADACKAFFSGRFKTLPVMEGDRLRGVITRREVLAAMREEGGLSGHTVGAHMTSPILTVDANAPLSVAEAMMKQSYVRRLAVLRNGHLVGLISVFDLLKANSGGRQRRPQMMVQASGLHAQVSSFMKENVVTISPQAPLMDAAERMLSEQVSALIVVDGLRPVGILTAKDVFESALYQPKQMSVLVSGLSGEEKDAALDVAAEARHMLAKLGSSIQVEALTLHVKMTGSEYFVSGHIRGLPPLMASASAYDLMGAVALVLDELKVQALKHKKTGISKRHLA